ncbi:IPTL-CTERM sorting domain-containing protein, partial [Enterococcus faecalis]
TVIGLLGGAGHVDRAGIEVDLAGQREGTGRVHGGPSSAAPGAISPGKISADQALASLGSAGGLTAGGGGGGSKYGGRPAA